MTLVVAKLTPGWVQAGPNVKAVDTRYAKIVCRRGVAVGVPEGARRATIGRRFAPKGFESPHRHYLII